MPGDRSVNQVMYQHMIVQWEDRHLAEAGLAAVDPHDASLHGSCHTFAALCVSRDYSGCQTILGAICDCDSFLLCAKCSRSKDRPKNFLPPQAHLGLHVDENCGLHKVPT